MGKLINKIKKGSIVLAVWINKAIVKGETLELSNITISRFYKDKNEKWQYGNQFRPNDLKDIHEAIEEYMKNNEPE